jgi:hypothetical protein
MSTSAGCPPRLTRSVTNRPPAPLSTSAVGCASPMPAGKARTSAVRNVPSASMRTRATPPSAATQAPPASAGTRKRTAPET